MRHRRPVPQGPRARARARPADRGDARHAVRPRARQRGLRRLWRRKAGRHAKLTLRGTRPADVAAAADRVSPRPSRRAQPTHRTTPMSWSLCADAIDVAALRDWLAREAPAIDLVGRGRRMELYKEVGLPETVRERFGLAAMTRHPRHRPHPHGDRIGGDHRRRPSLFDRPRPVPRAQRLAVQPQRPPPRPQARGLRLRDRERHRGRRRLSHAGGCARGCRSATR